MAIDIWTDEVGRRVQLESDGWEDADSSDHVAIGKRGQLRCMRHKPALDLEQVVPERYRCPRPDCWTESRTFYKITETP